MTKKTLNTLFGLGLAGLVKLLDPSPAHAQDYTPAPSSQAVSGYAGTAIPEATGHTRYSGLFYISRTDGDDVCFRQRGERSGGVETHAGNTPSRFEDDSTFIHFYKEFTTVGFLTGDADVDWQVQEGLARLHTGVWNGMYAGGASVANEDDWEFTWQDGELMGIQVRADRVRPLRQGAHQYARTLPANDPRRRTILHGAIFTHGRHSYWTNGPLDVCIEQSYVIPDSIVCAQEQDCGDDTTTGDTDGGVSAGLENAIDGLLRGQEGLRDDLREHDRRIFGRINRQERARRGDDRPDGSHDHVSVVGGFAHQWVTLEESNNGGRYGYRADGSGGRARVHFAGEDIIFSLMGGAYTGNAAIDGVANGIPFYGEASGLDIVGHTSLVYLPWRAGDDLRVGLGAELVFNIRDLHDIVYQIGEEEVRDQNVTEVFGALAPGMMLAYRGDIAVVEAFLGLGPAFEHRTDSDETQASGLLTARLLTAFQAGDHFIPYLQGNGAVDFRDGQFRTRVGAEAGVIVQFGDFIIGPAGSIDYRRAEGHGFARGMMDYQVYLFTGFRTGGQGRSGNDGHERDNDE